ncbi:MAG: alpha-L-fucosidase [Capnocytophaga sp.]|nr:alpha-L-fucosidase [Capnocytophaga sp.]
MKKITYLLGALMLFPSCKTKQVAPEALKPYGAVPTQRQIDWQKMEYYAFIHFNMNTFTDMEWGYGDERPSLFNPTEMDVEQWVKVIKDAGMTGVILTAKHHDGFCLWPSKYTEHSVKNSPWKNGKGDVVAELSEACKKYGLKMGVYLSPWDRNHPEYGRPEYVTYFHNQLRELMTNYGEIFEVWFDGANGGDGYYGGANEKRTIDSKTYYEWDKTIQIIRELQPNAAIFGDGGPDVRWIGNERGEGNETNWSTINRSKIAPGEADFHYLNTGEMNAPNWVPAEADVSIRPGWYYHKREDHQVHSIEKLANIYYASVGRNATLLLNIPVDTRGLVHEKDIEQLQKLKKVIESDFKTPLLPEKNYWVANNLTDYKEYVFDKPITFNRFLVQEDIKYGQRVKEFELEAFIHNKWQKIEEGTTIGYKRILRFSPITASAIRLHIKDALANAVISNIQIYNAPPLIVSPKYERKKGGIVKLNLSNNLAKIYYTLDGSTPTANSLLYTRPILIDTPTTLRYVAYYPETDTFSEVMLENIDVPKKDWKVVEVSSGDLEKAANIIDEDNNTWFFTEKSDKKPYILIDLGKKHKIKGLKYMPAQDRWAFGHIINYKLEVSEDKNSWKTIQEGTFDNIKNNPTLREVFFTPVEAKYLRITAKSTTDENNRASFGEIGIITK